MLLNGLLFCCCWLVLSILVGVLEWFSMPHWYRNGMPVENAAEFSSYLPWYSFCYSCGFRGSIKNDSSESTVIKWMNKLNIRPPPTF